MNIAALLAKSAQTFPERPALTRATTPQLTYAGFHAAAGRIAGALREDFGLADGDRVAMAMTNGSEFYEVLFGIWYGGLVAVPMNAKLHPDEFAYIIENSGARVAFLSASLADAVDSLVGRCGDLQRVVVVGDDDYSNFARYGSRPPAFRPSDTPAWLFYTSGTTGRPKGATLTHRNLLMMTLSYFADIDVPSPQDCILHAAPMSHGSGLYGLAHVAKAANNVIPESGGFDSGEVFDMIGKHRGVMMFAAPTMIVRMMNSVSVDADTSNLKLICYGGGPMYVADTERALQVFGPKLVQIYGQGESPMTISYLSREIHMDKHSPRYRERLASVGIARTDVELRVFDSEDRELPTGQVGEVVVRGDVVMPGYWDNPEATAETLRGGWLHTGDLGSVDDDGFLTLIDRSRDLIISGGANIYPREVEEVLLRHPAVMEAAVVGAAHPEWGEEVVAFVVGRPGQNVDAEELDIHCLKFIARFKRPRRYLFEESLPKNNYGKILKRELRDRLHACSAPRQPAKSNS